MKPDTKITFYGATLRRERGSWHYDGPAQYGPAHVRKPAGRGFPFETHWRGDVSPQFVGALLRAVRRSGLDVRIPKPTKQTPGWLPAVYYPRKATP